VQDCNFEACTSVQHLPTLASLLLNIILKKSSTAKYVKDLIFVFFPFVIVYFVTYQPKLPLMFMPLSSHLFSVSRQIYTAFIMHVLASLVAVVMLKN